MSRAFAVLPLHHGRAPRWLFSRMVELAGCIVEIIIHEYGVRGLLERLSDPWFFQSMSCVLGYDWHSSGTTTVTCGALKEVLRTGVHGVALAGGKGRASMRVPSEIDELGLRMGLSTGKLDGLKYASRMAAKVDNALIQDGYTLYHHSFIFDEEGNWIVIQQGMNEEEGNARRYHWPLEHNSLVEEPHNAILCDKRLPMVLDMTSTKSRGNREASLEIAREGPKHLKGLLRVEAPPGQGTLDDWSEGRKALVMPPTINWEALKKAYEFQPESYEELISIRGLGPSTVRGLALIAELIYGERPSWSDPVRFSFAFGGKDGVPFPVDRRAMDEAIDVLKTGILSSYLKREEKLRALERLRRCVPPVRSSKLT